MSVTRATRTSEPAFVGGTVLVAATAGDDARESDQNADCGKARSAHDSHATPWSGA